MMETISLPSDNSRIISEFTAPDGYSTDYTMEDIIGPFPKGYYYAGTTEAMSFVRYPNSIPSDVKEGKEIPDILWLLLAFERDGKILGSSMYEKGTGKLAGEGSYRSIKPQRNLMGDPSKLLPDILQVEDTLVGNWS